MVQIIIGLAHVMIFFKYDPLDGVLPNFRRVLLVVCLWQSREANKFGHFLKNEQWVGGGESVPKKVKPVPSAEKVKSATLPGN